MLRFVVRAAAVAILVGTAVLPVSAEEIKVPITVVPRPPAISVVTAAVRPVAEVVSVTGTLTPREEVLVSVDVNGLKIDKLLVDVGDMVKAGDVLAHLSTDTLDVELAQNDSQLKRSEAAIEQARSEIDQAHATLVEVEAALTRTQALVAKEVVSQNILEQRTSAARIAKARVATAEQGIKVAEADKALIEAQRREIELRMSKTEIRAPTDGLILERAARIGAVTSPTGGALFRIARDGLVELAAEIIETDLGPVHTGQTVIVTPAAGPPVTGTVRLVSPEVNSATRLGMVRVAFPPEIPLRVGAFGRGTIEVARRDGVTVPVSAVVTSGDTATVQVVVDGMIAVRTVETGLSAGGFVEIVDGLAAGEVVVGRAGTFLRAGDRITPVSDAAQEIKG